MKNEQLQTAANAINQKVEEYMAVTDPTNPSFDGEESLQVFLTKQKVMEYLQENAETLKAVIMAGLVEADGEIITERIIAEAILSEVKTGKEVLHATEFKLEENDELGIYRVAHPVINLDGYWVWFDAREEYAEVRYNYNNRIEGTTAEDMEDAAGQDLEDAYNYDKVSRITTPGEFFEVDEAENLI